MELTQEELDAKIAEAKTAGATETSAKLVEGTTWSSPEAMLESAQNADKKITEVSGESKTLKDQLATEQAALVAANKTIEDLKVKKVDDPPPPKDNNPPPVVIDHSAVLRTITDEEEKALDEIAKGDETLMEAIRGGGEKAMAEALLGLRKLTPEKLSDSPFSDWRKNASKPSEGSKSMEELLKEAHEKRMKGQRPPASTGPKSPVMKPIGDKSEAAPVRGGGGAREFAMAE